MSAQKKEEREALERFLEIFPPWNRFEDIDPGDSEGYSGPDLIVTLPNDEKVGVELTTWVIGELERDTGMDIFVTKFFMENYNDQAEDFLREYVIFLYREAGPPQVNSIREHAEDLISYLNSLEPEIRRMEAAGDTSITLTPSESSLEDVVDRVRFQKCKMGELYIQYSVTGARYMPSITDRIECKKDQARNYSDTQPNYLLIYGQGPLIRIIWELADDSFKEWIKTNGIEPFKAIFLFDQVEREYREYN